MYGFVDCFDEQVTVVVAQALYKPHVDSQVAHYPHEVVQCVGSSAPHKLRVGEQLQAIVSIMCME